MPLSAVRLSIYGELEPPSATNFGQLPPVIVTLESGIYSPSTERMVARISCPRRNSLFFSRFPGVLAIFARFCIAQKPEKTLYGPKVSIFSLLKCINKNE